jgi:hypothetical protein
MTPRGSADQSWPPERSSSSASSRPPRRGTVAASASRPRRSPPGAAAGVGQGGGNTGDRLMQLCQGISPRLPAMRRPTALRWPNPGRQVKQCSRLAGQRTPKRPASAIGQRPRTGNTGLGQTVLQGQVKIEGRGDARLEQGEHEATGRGRHEVIGILHAGRNAGMLDQIAEPERLEPGGKLIPPDRGIDGQDLPAVNDPHRRLDHRMGDVGFDKLAVALVIDQVVGLPTAGVTLTM